VAATAPDAESAESSRGTPNGWIVTPSGCGLRNNTYRRPARSICCAGVPVDFFFGPGADLVE
jgi:hypothetical protein